MPVMTYTETVTIVHCWCGIAVGIPDSLYGWMQKSSKNSCHCPNGHKFHFSRTLEDELEETRAQLNRSSQREKATRDLLDHEQRSHAATRGHLTRRQRELGRVRNGVCPCCNRTFKDLARHMQSQHPEYK